MVLIVLSIVFSGCFRGEVKVNINDDGSSDLHYQIIAVPMAGTVEMMQGQIKDLEKSQFKIERVTEGEWVGFKADKHFHNVSELNSFKLFSGSEPGTPGITFDKGWFYDAYKVSVLNDISLNQGQPLTNLDQAMLAQMSMKITMNFPVKPEAHNASNVYNEGKTLEWLLSFTKENHLEATAKVWHYGHIAATAGIPLVVMLALFLQRRKCLSASEGGTMPKLLSLHPVIAGCIVAALISGAGVGYYSMFQTKPQVVPASAQQEKSPSTASTSQSPNQANNKETPAAAPAPVAIDASKSMLRGKWNGMSNIPDKGKNSISAMVNASGNELVLNLSMAGEGTANKAKTTAKVNLADNNTGTFSYQDNWKNQGSGSIRVENGKLILEIQGTTPDRKGWGVYPGRFVLDRWVD